ncbi:hypothetical protein HMPREF1142_1919 [Peptostreptococcaceae bacterium AS15]|nr:hypothetical protein HMPREF1142_1919 [Peptostreptococcaceae bacterium AS15]
MSFYKNIISNFKQNFPHKKYRFLLCNMNVIIGLILLTLFKFQ